MTTTNQIGLKQQWLISCPKGLEQLLSDELKKLGAEVCRETVAGVYCEASLENAYRIYLWSRLANRMLLQLGSFAAADSDELYRAAVDIDWQQHFGPDTTFAVRFSGGSKEITHTQFGARRIKDGVVDYFRRETGRRPDVDAKTPDIWIHAHLARGKVNIAIDFGGDSLHRRRYRVGNVPAPLKENLAAALLLRSRWPQLASEGAALIDPMCGSGTLLIEAGLIAADIAPGLMRDDFYQRNRNEGGHGFEHWLGHDENQWGLLLAEARQRRSDGLAADLPEIRGYDQDARAARAAEENIERAGLAGFVRVSQKPLSELKQPTHKALKPGLILTNPPYGERLGEQDLLRPLYYELGEKLKLEFPGWQAGVFTGNPELGPEMNLRAHKQYKLFNGAIPSKLLLFSIDAEPRSERPRAPEELSEGAKMFANRLKKNQRKLQPWLKREGVECYRLYDADMPEYSVAVDVYGDAVHLQEYEPPKSVDERAARRRFREVQQGIKEALKISDHQLFIKQRKRQKGSEQYQRHADSTERKAVRLVREGQAQLEVNLQEYLDTGLFLDHRPLRRIVAQEARGKRVLNLFCYTASISVQAALGGASETLSVDMSQTYLDWAGRNFELNNLDPQSNRLERADCLKWLDEASDTQQPFDLIILDPPTFSNSKKMDDVLDVQRDHGRMIRQCMRILAPGGILYFSNNFRRFQMDGDVLDFLDTEDITRQTIDPDFQRNQKIHNCWRIRKK